MTAQNVLRELMPAVSQAVAHLRRKRFARVSVLAQISAFSLSSCGCALAAAHATHAATHRCRETAVYRHHNRSQASLRVRHPVRVFRQNYTNDPMEPFDYVDIGRLAVYPSVLATVMTAGKKTAELETIHSESLRLLVDHNAPRPGAILRSWTLPKYPAAELLRSRTKRKCHYASRRSTPSSRQPVSNSHGGGKVQQSMRP